eukprot:1467665-Pleurochrysis_carterae.AAC.5
MLRTDELFAKSRPYDLILASAASPTLRSAKLGKSARCCSRSRATGHRSERCERHKSFLRSGE